MSEAASARPRRPAQTGTDKRYDRAYFERWYHAPGTKIRSRADLERKVLLAVAACEYVIGGPLRTVLDVGAGEGEWGLVLRRLRPRASYVGVEPSAYAVGRPGARRSLRLATLDALEELGFTQPFDLVVCSDVLHYIATPQLRRGLPQLARLVSGMAFCDLFVTGDAAAGDMRGWHRRTAAFYRAAFAAADVVSCGLHCYVSRERAAFLWALEKGANPDSSR